MFQPVINRDLGNYTNPIKSVRFELVGFTHPTTLGSRVGDRVHEENHEVRVREDKRRRDGKKVGWVKPTRLLRTN